MNQPLIGGDQHRARLDRQGNIETVVDGVFVRIGTSARAFERPMSLAQATSHISSWLDRQVTNVLQPDVDHARHVLALLHGAASAGGNLVTDAQIAAVSIAHHGTVHTADRDFMRFKGLACCYPLDEP